MMVRINRRPSSTHLEPHPSHRLQGCVLNPSPCRICLRFAISRRPNVDQLVTAVDGQTLTLKYKDGEKKSFVSANRPIVAYVPGDKNDLKVGVKVFIISAKQPDGTLQGRSWRVGRDGSEPLEQAAQSQNALTFGASGTRCSCL